MRRSLAAALMLLLSACGNATGGTCGNGAELSSVTVTIDGAIVSQGLGACAHTAGSAVIVTLPEGYEINVSTPGRTGPMACDYEGGAVATMTKNDGSGDRWEAIPGSAFTEASCTITVSEATSGGVPITGSFDGNLARGKSSGGTEVAQIHFDFHIPPAE
jgi:hypothetical protein